MGCHLDGPPIAHADGFNIVSDGIVNGSIQVPATDGRSSCSPTATPRAATRRSPRSSPPISAASRRCGGGDDPVRGRHRRRGAVPRPGREIRPRSPACRPRAGRRRRSRQRIPVVLQPDRRRRLGELRRSGRLRAGRGPPAHRRDPTMLTPFHLAYHVTDLEAARRFYGGVLGCREGRSTETWVDFDFFGHQISLHLGEPFATTRTGKVGNHLVMMPHLGVVLPLDAWEALAARIEAEGIAFDIPPVVRFRGSPVSSGPCSSSIRAEIPSRSKASEIWMLSSNTESPSPNRAGAASKIGETVPFRWPMGRDRAAASARTGQAEPAKPKGGRPRTSDRAPPTDAAVMTEAGRSPLPIARRWSSRRQELKPARCSMTRPLGAISQDWLRRAGVGALADL